MTKQKEIQQETKMNVNSHFRLLICIVLISCLSGFLSAQQVRNINDYSRGDWFIGLGVGPRIYFADHADELSLADRLSLGSDLYFGKWWGPYVGTRLGFSFQTLKGATEEGLHRTYDYQRNVFLRVEGQNMWKQQFDAWNFYGDLLFDVSSLFQGPDEFRFWSLVPFVGLGHINTFDKPTGHEVSFSLGLLNSLKLSRTVDLSFDIRGAMFKDRFKVGVENYPAKPNKPHDSGDSSMDGILSVNVGVTFRFGGSSGYVYQGYQPEPVQPVAPPPSRSSGTAKYREWIDVATDVLILFREGESALTKDARVQLGFLARLMHEYPEGTYTITGYGDGGTGSLNASYALSRGRAERVRDCLVGEFGISPDRLKTVAFDNRDYRTNDPAQNRSAIIRPNKY